MAYAVVGDKLFVLEKQDNTLLQLECADSSKSLRLVSSRRIERDDNRYYYMVRNLHPGKNGVVTHSFIYERETRRFVGYRFREYGSPSAPPREILTVFPKDPDRFAEFSYTFDKDGRHIFGHNSEGHRNLWIVPPEGGAQVLRNDFPPTIRECGEENKPLSNWGPVHAAPDGYLYMVCNEKGRIIRYTADGRNFVYCARVERPRAVDRRQHREPHVGPIRSRRPAGKNPFPVDRRLCVSGHPDRAAIRPP